MEIPEAKMLTHKYTWERHINILPRNQITEYFIYKQSKLISYDTYFALYIKAHLSITSNLHLGNGRVKPFR